MTDPSLTERLLALWDHLGLRTAHLAAQMPGDLAGLALRYPERIAGLVLCESSSIEPDPLRGLAPRLTIVAGDAGNAGRNARTVAPYLPGCRLVTLPGYAAPIWADSVADHTETIVAALRDLPGEASVPRAGPQGGTVAGLRYRIEGSGPALVLMPLLLSAAQWEPAIPALARHFSVVVLGGRHLSGVALLEDRALNRSYLGMVDTLLDAMAPGAGESILEVGCGSGALARRTARRDGGTLRVTAVDLNRFLLREAVALAEEEGLGAAITFGEANAETLPFPDGAFDHAYSVTVLEECDADRALRELLRVVKPGGRAGVIVRATDMAHPWSMDLPEALRAKAEIRPPLVGPGGVADRSLYRRMAEAGFEGLRCFPMLATFDRMDGPFMRFFEGGVLGRLSPEDVLTWQAARDAADRAGVLFAAGPHHCAVGRKPG